MPHPRLARDRSSTSIVVLAGLTIVAALLRCFRLDAGLPYVFHSDSFQIDQAFALLEQGWFVDNVNYPHALVYAYAALAYLEYAARWLVATWSDLEGVSFSEWVEVWRDPAHRQLSGRAFSVACGSLLVPATFALARARFGREVGLLAAAAIAFDPGHLITAQQVRPHVPVALAIVVGATFVLRAAGTNGDSRLARRGGAILGVAAACFQLGWFAWVWGLCVLLATVRPAREAWMRSGWYCGSFAVVYSLISTFAHRSEIARESISATARDAATTLSLPALLVARGSFDRLVDAAGAWFACSPVSYLLVLWFVASLAFRRGADSARREAIPYLAFPALILAAMGGFVASFARYSLVATPFLVVLAAAAIRAIDSKRGCALLGIVWLGSAAAASIRYLDLLGTVDTRIEAAAAVLELEGRGASVAIQDRILVDRELLGASVLEFPPHDPSARVVAAGIGPLALLEKLRATVFFTAPGSVPRLSESDLVPLGFVLVGTIVGGPERILGLPDFSERLYFDLARVNRCGPTIQVYARGSGRVAWDAHVAAGGVRSPSSAAGVRRAISSRVTSSAAAGPSWSAFEFDLDGDGRNERCVGNLDAVTFERLRREPRAAWEGAGGARGAEDPPRLEVTSGLESDQILIVVRGLEGHREIALRVEAQVDDAPRRSLVVRLQNAGAEAMIFVSSWRSELPIGTRIELQVFVSDDRGRVVASDRSRYRPPYRGAGR